jgi:hypothetical protein
METTRNNNNSFYIKRENNFNPENAKPKADAYCSGNNFKHELKYIINRVDKVCQ